MPSTVVLRPATLCLWPRVLTRRGFRTWLFTLVLALGSTVPTRAEVSDGLEFFEKQIRPILTDNCYPCHSAQAQKVKGGLRLDEREALMKGGDSGPVVIPGD